jgi:predicted PurR-regulated permease PerM
MLDKMSHGMGGYFRGVIITGAIVGVASYIGMLIIGIEFALFLAIVAAMMEFIPMIGPLISGILIATFAFLQSPTKALITIPFVLALQQIENHIIAPNVMHPQTNISRLATVFVIFAGWSVGGVLGALVAIPLYAAFRVFTSEIILPMARRQWGTHDEHKPPTS